MLYKITSFVGDLQVVLFTDDATIIQFSFKSGLRICPFVSVACVCVAA